MGNAKLPISWKWPAVEQKGVKFGMCNFWNFGQWPSFMPKYGNFENGPISRKPLPVERK